MDRHIHNAANTHERSRRAKAEVCDAAAGTAAILIVNADDWGGSAGATDPILDCVRCGAISSVSAMVFMEDSERAAELARAHAIDAGLHLNLTERFTAAWAPARLLAEQERIARFLRSSRFAPALYHPFLAASFDYVVKAQLDEFERLYGVAPHRLDGHHHAHLSANVQRQGLLPAGTIVRRNFTFAGGEKNALNRIYRRRQDRKLARRHRIADYFFNLAPIDEERLRQVAEFGRLFNVEIETHPERVAEYRFLLDGELERLGQNVQIAKAYELRKGSSRAVSLPAERDRTVYLKSEDAGKLPHISVCICTFKRPEPLKRLLRDLNRQNTGGLFTYSIVVADNDAERTGETAVEEMRLELAVPVKYCAEPQQGIARARNKVIANAEGDFVALIDDDEFPISDWLLKLYTTCKQYGVDGVLGPVRRHFDQEPPLWLKRSRLYDRAVNPTGMPVQWRGARTGNALLKRAVFAEDEAPFRVEFIAGEDQDFFRRKIEQGCSFVWSAEATAYEVLPPARWKRSYFVRKALLHGAYAARQPDCGVVSIGKSLVAVTLYTLCLPFALLAGQHRFMTLVVKLCDHAGKLLFLMKMNPVREEYVSE